jgi:predicted small lipoprotein YifL
MRNFFGIALCLSACFTMAGCGDSEPVNVGENADQAAIQSYDEMLAAEQESMNADPPQDQVEQ